jgi:hypothetical protein
VDRQGEMVAKRVVETVGECWVKDGQSGEECEEEKRSKKRGSLFLIRVEYAKDTDNLIRESKYW